VQRVTREVAPGTSRARRPIQGCPDLPAWLASTSPISPGSDMRVASLARRSVRPLNSRCAATRIRPRSPDGPLCRETITLAADRIISVVPPGAVERVPLPDAFRTVRHHRFLGQRGGAVSGREVKPMIEGPMKAVRGREEAVRDYAAAARLGTSRGRV
jgi:hypothetical protein